MDTHFKGFYQKIILPTIQNRGEGKNTPLGKSANNPLDRSRVKVDSNGWVKLFWSKDQNNDPHNTEPKD